MDRLPPREQRQLRSTRTACVPSDSVLPDRPEPRPADPEAHFDLPANSPQRTGFNDFLAALQTRTLAYGKPVVLVHGDSHYFRIDKPMLGAQSGRRVEHFTRVETFGENDNHWPHVTVEADNPNVFAFDQRIVAANLVQH